MSCVSVALLLGVVEGLSFLFWPRETIGVLLCSVALVLLLLTFDPPDPTIGPGGLADGMPTMQQERRATV